MIKTTKHNLYNFVKSNLKAPFFKKKVWKPIDPAFKPGRSFFSAILLCSKWRYFQVDCATLTFCLLKSCEIFLASTLRSCGIQTNCFQLCLESSESLNPPALFLVMKRKRRLAISNYDNSVKKNHSSIFKDIF